MENKQRDILLSAIKYLNMPLFYPGLSNTYVFEIDIDRRYISLRNTSLNGLSRSINSIYETRMTGAESSMISAILRCNINPSTKPQAIHITKRMTWIDNGSIDGVSTTGELVINPEFAIEHLKAGDLKAKEISRIDMNMVNKLLRPIE